VKNKSSDIKSGQNYFNTLARKLFWTFSSLKLAVLVIFSLACSLATATVLESIYDTPTAQYWVYRSWWFHLLLGLLGVNIFCVAMSRLPWKKRHIPFLLAHLGILTLLGGSLLTERVGIDGSLRVTEGETASVVDLDSASLIVSEGSRIKSIPIPWIPPGIQFQGIDAAKNGLPYDFKVDRFLSHADPVISFVPSVAPAIVPNDASHGSNGNSAIRVRMVGGPMGISEDIWLWEGAPGWKSIQAGPARLNIGSAIGVENIGSKEVGRPVLSFIPENDGSVGYIAQSSAGKKVQGRLRKGSIVGQVIHPGWRGNVTLTVTDWVPRAVAVTTYKPARVQYGSQAPTSAIHLVASQSSEMWLGLGDRAVLSFNDQEVEIGYFPKRLMLPFSVRLERFTVDHDQGTFNPAAYSSRVSVLDGKGQKDVNISMNEPLEFKGYTVYQASYEDADPRPITSIFAINQDPGRRWKYLGSFLIVLGSVLLFTKKLSGHKRQATKELSIAI